MHAGEPLAAVGVIEHCGAVAVVPPDDGDMARTPQYGHAGGRCGARKPVPVRHEPKIANGTPERLDARTAAAEQPRRAAGGMLNDLAAGVRIARRLLFLVRLPSISLMLNDLAAATRIARCFRYLVRRTSIGWMMNNLATAVRIPRRLRFPMWCTSIDNRSTLPAVRLAHDAGILRLIRPVLHRRLLNDRAPAVPITRRLRRLVGRTSDDNRSRLHAVRCAGPGILRSIPRIPRVHRDPLLCADARARANGGRCGAGRGSGTKQTNN